MSTKTYKITISNPRNLKILLQEFVAWRVKDSAYTVIGSSVYTTNKNVVDIATETFGGLKIDSVNGIPTREEGVKDVNQLSDEEFISIFG